MALADILGTNGGDFASFGLSSMPTDAVPVSGYIAGAMLYWGRNGRVVHVLYYWVLMAMIKTNGTSAGDFLVYEFPACP